MRYVLELAYRGTAYNGWQIQPDAKTVQATLQEKLRILARHGIEITGCGRTDAGVHGASYFAHFDIDNELSFSLKSLNALLPEDIAVFKIFRVPDLFHARFDAWYRKYVYQLHLFKNPFAPCNDHWFREAHDLDILKLNEAAALIKDTTDFVSFAKMGNDLEHYECRIYESKWEHERNGSFKYHIAANRFVRGMVRLIVGMSINYALDRISLDTVKSDILARKQITKSFSVAAEGLTLVEIRYPDEAVAQWELLDFRV